MFYSILLVLTFFVSNLNYNIKLEYENGYNLNEITKTLEKQDFDVVYRDKENIVFYRDNIKVASVTEYYSFGEEYINLYGDLILVFYIKEKNVIKIDAMFYTYGSSNFRRNIKTKPLYDAYYIEYIENCLNNYAERY
jgi:hypothetical protein